MPLTFGAPNTWVGELSYDAAGRMIGFGSYITDVAYGRWGGAIRTDYGNGLTELRSYRDTRGWIDAIRVEDSTGTELHPDTVYWRSATGRVTRVQGIAAPGGFDYTYDYAGRLLSAINHAGAGEHDQSFAYDSAGSMTFNNRLGTYVYPSATASHPHAPDTVAGQVFAYDANGNMTTGLDGKTMTYDGENRPVMVQTSVENGGIRTEYVYGADGSRLKLIDAVGTGDEATTLYLGPLEVRGFGSGSETIAAYPHSDVRIVGNDTSYLHRDQLASVQAMSNDLGQRATRRQYRPFGEISWEVIEQVTADEAHGFIGERFDEGAGLQYLNARYYDPELGLFLQPDWFEVTKAGVGTNRYAYSFNDPVNARDPEGNEVLIVPGTFSTGESWAYSGYEFYEVVQETFPGEKIVTVTNRAENGVREDLGVFGSSRTELAGNIARAVSEVDEGARVIIIAHSHGGNAVKEYTNSIEGGGVIDILVNLGTPQRTDYSINPDAVDNYINYYSEGDSVQLFGAAGSQAGDGRTDPLATNVAASAVGSFYVSTGPGQVEEHPVYPGHSELHTRDTWLRDLKEVLDGIQ